MGAFDRLQHQRTILATTYKRDGTGVPTPVNVAVDGDHAYVRTWSTSGKAKRLRNDPRITVAPSTGRGRQTGESMAATARRLDGEQERAAARLIDRKYPFLQGLLVHLVHRVRHQTTVHYELSA